MMELIDEAQAAAAQLCALVIIEIAAVFAVEEDFARVRPLQ